MSELADTFYVLDFDRCLGRTEKFQTLLEQAIEEDGTIDLAMIRYAHQQIKKTGGSFDTARYVRRILRDQGEDAATTWQRIEEAFISAARGQDVFEPYAKEFLSALDARQAHYGILTYGGKDWQLAKLQAADLLYVPHLITTHKEKGRMIASWQQPDKTFVIPAELAGKKLRMSGVVLVDDKPVSFEGIPPEVRGICVHPTSQTVVLPRNVTIVQGMEQATQLLFSHVIDKT
jgi:hypothetical protein